MTIDEHTCDTCEYGEWYRHGYDITMMDDECGGCCSWNDKWKFLDYYKKELESLKNIIQNTIKTTIKAF